MPRSEIKLKDALTEVEKYLASQPKPVEQPPPQPEGEAQK